MGIQEWGGNLVITRPDLSLTTLAQFMDDIGNGTGVKNANGNYSIVPQDFFIQPGIDESFAISSLNVLIRDNGALKAEQYGSVAELTNGISIVKQTGSSPVVSVDFTNGFPIKSNSDWGRFAFDVMPSDFGGGDNFFLVKWIFEPLPLLLKGKKLDKLVITLNDDLTPLIQHTFFVRGFKF